VFDSKSFLVNNTFDNFRQSYTGAISGCGSNFAFKTHASAHDIVGGVNLYTSTCSNCDRDSFVYCDPPNPAHLGWFGGCGDILCTGKQNYLVSDFTGTFFGVNGTIIPNNSVIAANEANCTFSAPMNGYLCTRQDFVVLQYHSTAPDFKTRIMWPVSLIYDGSNYTTYTNGFREW
jgi:hypothetical protein